MGQYLTQDELDQIDILLGMVRVSTEAKPEEAPNRVTKPFFRKGEVPLPLEHEAHAENFLVAEMQGRCKLSGVTRRLEEKRLALRAKVRKPYSSRGKGRYHHKRKEATKRKQRVKAWEKYGLDKLKHTFRQGVVISQAQWDRLIEPVWGPKARVVQAVRGGPVTVYNIQVLREGRVVYDGPDQQILDAQDVRYSGDVLKKCPPETLL